jgi:hypothetical protein
MHLLWAVMDSVKTPEQRDFVAPAMAPVEADFANHHGRSPAQPYRPSCHGSCDAPGMKWWTALANMARGALNSSPGARLFMKW